MWVARLGLDGWAGKKSIYIYTIDPAIVQNDDTVIIRLLRRLRLPARPDKETERFQASNTLTYTYGLELRMTTR